MINTNAILKKYQIRLTKSLGQNFLTDINILNKIADAGDLNAEDLVIEVGPGIGALTAVLAQRAGKVVAVEIDKHLIPALHETTGSFDNITVINEDIMKVDIHALIHGWAGPIKVISNLPYYVTTPVVMLFLESHLPVERMVLMVQKEVAHRMSAKPGGKEYGALSVGIQVAGSVKLLFQVSRHCFIPKPDVDSAVIRIELTDQILKKIHNRLFFSHCVKAAFAQRRKTLVNAMGTASNIDAGKERIREILAGMGIEETIRGEALSPEQFITLSNRLWDSVSRGIKGE